MKNITIYIDESGTLPDPKDQVVIIAAVGTKLPEKLRAKVDQETFNQLLTMLLNKQINIIHADSQKDFQVNAADMVAGSLLWLKTGKESSFYEIIKEKIISERVISWKNLRRMFFDKKSR